MPPHDANSPAVARNQLRSASDTIKNRSKHAYMAVEHARDVPARLKMPSERAYIAAERE